MMQEKELRLALVLTGGISLAIYMHGAAKELLKLARASKLYHATPDLKEKQQRSFADMARLPRHVLDTEAVYFDILKTIGQQLDLRVIIDVIAGASAGGINGVLLGRALAHDLPFEDLRELWLTNGDVDRLADEELAQKSLSSRLLQSVFGLFTKGEVLGLKIDNEVRNKLTALVPFRALRPPFDGRKLTRYLLDAFQNMGAPLHHGDSLMPADHALDVMLTVTDFYGYTREIPLYDPPVIREREHRHILRYGYLRRPNGDETSDFTLDGVPGLVFGARATASFPGVFPPTQLREIDAVLAERGQTWAAKDSFLQKNFARYRQVEADPEATSFIDGSVLNDKPFRPALDAIALRPAYRQVDRRLVFINPAPAGPPPPATGRAPGFWRVLRGSLSDIPRNEPIYNDLASVREFNHDVQNLRDVIEGARPDIEGLVEDLTKGKLDRSHMDDKQISDWRDLINSRAASAAGFTFKGYARRKLLGTLEFLAHLLADACGYEDEGSARAFILGALEAWAAKTDAWPAEDWDPSHAIAMKGEGKDRPAWITFLRNFDMAYRQRRLQFVIAGLNRLYPRLNEAQFRDFSAYRLDYIKTGFYEVLENLRLKGTAAALSHDSVQRAGRLFHEALVNLTKRDPHGVTAMTGEATTLGSAFAASRQDALEDLISAVSRDLSLEVVNNQADNVLAAMEIHGAGGAVRRELLVAYLGFSFWDVLTFVSDRWRGMGELNEIRISRISPEDVKVLNPGGVSATLRGIKFGNFGAFFKRAYRENDYLWGRLNSAERLIDILCDAAGIEGASEALDPVALKQAAFEAILNTEAEHLKDCADLIARLKQQVAELGKNHIERQSL